MTDKARKAPTTRTKPAPKPKPAPTPTPEPIPKPTSQVDGHKVAVPPKKA